MSSSNFQKYQSRNPLRKLFIKRFQRNLEGLFSQTGARTVLDVGCGEGFTIHYLRNLFREVQFSGIDVNADAINQAKKTNPFADFKVGSIFDLPYPGSSFDLVICSEVLEHLKEPEKALKELGRVSNKYLLLSVPNEPWFRISSFLSGKYLKTRGNHPEHIQNWNKKEFISLVQKQFPIITGITSFPWTMVLCGIRS